MTASAPHPPGYRDGYLYSDPHRELVLRTSFDVEAYTRSAHGRITVPNSGIAIGERTRRDLNYLWRVETGALSEMRTVLASWTGNEARITAFLATWAYERYWFGRALGDVLAAAGEAPTPRANLALTVRLRNLYVESIAPIGAPVVAIVLGEQMTAGQMARMAIHERALSLAYRQLAERVAQGPVGDVLAEIANRRTRIVEFFELEASARIRRSRTERVSAAWHLGRHWSPLRVVGIADADEARAIRSIFRSPQARAELSESDRPLSAMLPGRPTPAANLIRRTDATIARSTAAWADHPMFRRK